MVTSHGDRCGGHYKQWFREKAGDWEALHDDANQLPHNYTCPQAYRTPVPEELYPTTYIADQAVDWLKGRKGAKDPFFAFVSFPDPHHPFNPPGKYWDMYHPDEFEITLPYSAHKNPTPPMEWMTRNWETGVAQLTAQTGMRVDEQHAREAMALTAGMITMIDDQVGRLIAALKETGDYDNTVIIFTSDHGDYLGDFSLLLKGAMPFRSITQVPFIWSDPESRAAGESGELASTIDISASVLERAGLEPYRGMQGQSLLSTMRAGEAHRDELLMEYNDGPARLGFPTPARMRTLRTKEWRYTMYGGQDWGELYHVAEDPGETHNLWDDPAHRTTRAHLAERLTHHLTAQMDESPQAERLA